MNTPESKPARELNVRELDTAELEAVSGGRLPAQLQNIVNEVACVTHGGDWFNNGTATVCAGA